MIFLSHNHNDKVIVEQVAIKLREVFGQDQIFYDSWSMQPGDGIIDKMNEGIRDCKLFLFFVSKNSLQSKMVELEWQNALMKATKGETKIVPVRIDDCFMPPILLQSIYIDLFGKGLEVAVRQIVDVSQGRNTFSKGVQEFSNLKSYAYYVDSKLVVECHAEHYLEPISSYLFLIGNSEDELKFNCKSSSLVNQGFNKNLKLTNGMVANAQLMGIERGTAPGFPFVIEIEAKTNKPIDLKGVMHAVSHNEWKMIPLINRKK